MQTISDQELWDNLTTLGIAEGNGIRLIYMRTSAEGIREVDFRAIFARIKAAHPTHTGLAWEKRYMALFVKRRLEMVNKVDGYVGDMFTPKQVEILSRIVEVHTRPLAIQLHRMQEAMKRMDATLTEMQKKEDARGVLLPETYAQLQHDVTLDPIPGDDTWWLEQGNDLQ